MQGLTDENKKALTIFLGECWHEEEAIPNLPHLTWCKKCHYIGFTYLDFTDWRVVGRLVSKVSGDTWVSVYGPPSHHPQDISCTIGDEDNHITEYGNSLQEAIIAAVLAYLEDV